MTEGEYKSSQRSYVSKPRLVKPRRDSNNDDIKTVKLSSDETSVKLPQDNQSKTITPLSGLEAITLKLANMDNNKNR